MDSSKHPTDQQRAFFKRHILGEEPAGEESILSIKVVREKTRGFSVNIRGPFKLSNYEFKDTNGETVNEETVIDASWAGPQESQAHLHCCWSEIQFAKLLRTTDAVRQNIGYDWQLCFFATQAAADFFDPLKPQTDSRLFWFYVKDDEHKAVQTLGKDEKTIPVA